MPGDKDNRMTAFPNVTVATGGAQGRRRSPAEDNLKDRLTTNRQLLLRNVSATARLVDLCAEHGVISGKQKAFIQKIPDENNQRMVLLLDNLRLQEPAVFAAFCDILMMDGHPLIANYLRDSVLSSKTFNFDDLWEQLPNLNKMLRQWEKEKLSSYLSGKMKDEITRLSLNDQVNERERATDARIKQVEQSWKFQKEIKERETAVTHLQGQVQQLETSLAVKGQEQQQQKASLQRDIEKLSGTVEIATKFNMANDKAIRRLQDGLELYKSFTAGIEERVGRVDSAARRHRDRPGPPSREETSLEGLRLEFDTERHLEHLHGVLDRILGELDALRLLKRQHEALTAAAQHVSHQLTPLDASLSLGREGADEGSRLRQAYAAFVLRNEERLGTMRGEAELLHRFVRGRLPSPEVPDALRDLTMVPRSEKEELQQRVEELEKELAAREEPKAERRDRTDSCPAGPAAPAPAASHRRSQPPNAPVATGIPFAYHSKRTQREPKPKPDARTNNAKILSTRVVNFL